MGKPFGIELLVQSVVMIAAQMYMINFCLYYKRAKPGRTIFTNPYDNFWDWDDFNSFLIFVVGLWAGLSIMTYAMMTNLMFVEVLGFLALGLEACLGLP